MATKPEAVLGGYYRDAQRALVEVLHSGTVRGRARSATMLAKVDRIMSEADRKAFDWIEREVPKKYRAGSRAAVRDLRELGVDGPLATDFGAIHEEAVRAIAETAAADLGGASARMRFTMKRALRAMSQEAIPDAEIRREVAKALISGDPRRKLSRALGDKLRASEVRGVVDAAAGTIRVGKSTFTIDNYARLLGRTQLREAVSRGTENRLTANGYDLLVITGPDTDCEICGPEVGSIYSISGTHPDYPALAGAPAGGTPFHPNCEHTESPYIEALRRDEAA